MFCSSLHHRLVVALVGLADASRCLPLARQQIIVTLETIGVPVPGLPTSMTSRLNDVSQSVAVVQPYGGKYKSGGFE